VFTETDSEQSDRRSTNDILIRKQCSTQVSVGSLRQKFMIVFTEISSVQVVPDMTQSNQMI
jgi:hypothetical protein